MFEVPDLIKYISMKTWLYFWTIYFLLSIMFST